MSERAHLHPRDSVTIAAALDAAAERFADDEAVVDGDVRLSFRDVLDQSNEFASGVVARGLVSGDRVAVWAPNSYRWIVAALGLLRAGAVLVPINTRFKGEEARFVIDKAGARMLVVDNDFLGLDYLGMLGGVGTGRQPLPSLPDVVAVVNVGSREVPRTWNWERFQSSGSSADLSEVQRRTASLGPDDLADIMFTSGTTGSPKGAMSGHRQNIIVNSAWSDAVGLRRGDRYLAVNPFFNSFGYKAGVLASMLNGATIFPQPSFDVERAMSLVEAEKLTVIPGPPTLYSAILDHPARSSHDLTSARLAVTGAAVVPVALIERMHRELTFTTIITAYGLTETCGTATVCPVDADPETVSTTVGLPIPGTEVAVVDEAGERVDVGSPGEVVVRGCNVMMGYFNNPKATADTIDADGWLHTGDVGSLDDRGYLRITDRIKDMFVVGGFNAYPAEIEQVIMRFRGVLEVAVIGVPDERLGEVGCAYVVPGTGHSLSDSDLIEFCKERLANYKVPRSVVFVPALPRNATGKVLKVDLRAAQSSAMEPA